MPERLYLIPTPLVETDEPFLYVPLFNKEVICGLDCFVVEELRTARRFLSKCKIGKPIDSLRFFELNEHTAPMQIEEMLRPLFEGNDVGLMSEAGVPGVADPGAELVALAHKKGIEVIPLIGPSSILLSLMASGMNGQSFCFNGYLPVKTGEKIKKIKELEHRALVGNVTQLFIEAPYRNERLFDELLRVLNPLTRLCVAVNITAPTQFIRTATIGEWRKSAKPDFHKIPAIFLIGA